MPINSYASVEYGKLIIFLLSVFFLFIQLRYWFFPTADELSFGGYLTASLVSPIILILFYKMKIEVTESRLRILYGVGIIKVTYRLTDVIAAEQTHTPWYYGLGWRITPQGILYNIQSLRAVKITFKDENRKTRTIFIGTPHPAALTKALKQG